MQEGVPKNEDKKINSVKSIDHLLNDFSNEIPEKMARELIEGGSNFGSEYYKLKVRINWFHGVLSTLESAYYKGFLPEDFWKEITDFIKKFKESHIKTSDRTTKEEIEKADDLLRRAKEFIEKK